MVELGASDEGSPVVLLGTGIAGASAGVVGAIVLLGGSVEGGLSNSAELVLGGSVEVGDAAVLIGGGGLQGSAACDSGCNVQPMQTRAPTAWQQDGFAEGLVRGNQQMRSQRASSQECCPASQGAAWHSKRMRRQTRAGTELALVARRGFQAEEDLGAAADCRQAMALANLAVAVKLDLPRKYSSQHWQKCSNWSILMRLLCLKQH